MILLLLLIIAFVANSLASMAGGGAGLIQFPILLFLGLPFPIALATHKVATIALGIGATFKFTKEKLLERALSYLMLLIGVPGVILGARTILFIPESIAKLGLGILTLGLGCYSIMNTSLGQTHHKRTIDWPHTAIGGAGIFGIAFLNGSLSSGTGLFATMFLIKWFGYDYKTAVAHTLVLVGLFWNATGAITLGFLSHIQWDWLPPLILGSLLGGYTGASIALLKGNQWIKRCFEILTLAVGVMLISNGLGGI